MDKKHANHSHRHLPEARHLSTHLPQALLSAKAIKKTLTTAYFICTSIIAVFFLASFADAQLPQKTQTKLDRQLQLNAKRYGVVGQSVRILKKGRLQYQGNAGFANIELAVPIQNQHIFPGYSISKLFTSVLVMQRVEQGHIDPEHPIGHYLPNLPKHWKKVSVAHLLNHTSGIPEYFETAFKKRYFIPSKQGVFQSLFDQPNLFELGTQNQYNNTNYLLLAAILEAQTGKTFYTLVNERIIRPLELKHTQFASAKRILNNAVSSYRGNKGVVQKNTRIDWPEYSFCHSAIYTNAEDLTAFMSALAKGALVKPSTLKELWSPMTLKNGKEGVYAFGFEYSVEDNYLRVGHGGGNQVKLRHYIHQDNNEKTFTIAYMTNGNAFDTWTDVLLESMMSIVAPEEFITATLKEGYLTAILNNDKDSLEKIFTQLGRTLNNKDAIEQFLMVRAYALKYGAHETASQGAFQFLLEKFPNNALAQKELSALIK